ncbi:Phospholipase D/nuclease [Glarea lozoyensis ATCC 20868]|uniref:Phospholipase D/nuclease n=1 Tax=Glarea lozoyensis (strain ATCC 20868 / MF5171) TaxID=1116229 RepID=S3DAA4_GLAL2|nr:Phospholipase D/nuclease [Glarea lozoyensis ATCC 20868]EPE35377.1 Phospholipase D/nuclease [Glarea lozoyensis ATCC 20868]
MISEKVHKLCTGTETVSSLLAADPTLAPGEAWKKLYGGHSAGKDESTSTAKAHRNDITSEDLKRALECGNWGPTKPSELFLRLYHDALCTLDKSVSGCMVSPPLMGSCGTIPLTIISVLPDIMRHMSNMIVRADKEVILATNYWQNSVASKYITNAMKELSKRAGERGERIVFKIEYDRGSPKQVFNNHMEIKEEEYLGKAVALPSKAEIPNIDLQVINYHRPLVGTFHCKYMIVDRKIAVLQSNNIQDNDNLEMMTHLEGPIVDSLYDMALISWSNKLEPPLPSYNSPAVRGGIGAFGEESSQVRIFGQDRAIERQAPIMESGKRHSQEASAYDNQEVKLPGIVSKEPSSATTPTDGSSLATGPSTSKSVSKPIHEEEIPEENTHNGYGNKDTRTSHDHPPSDVPHSEFETKHMGTTERLQENARVAATTGDLEDIAHEKPDDGSNGLVTGLVKNRLKDGNNTKPSTKSTADSNGNVASVSDAVQHHGAYGPDEESKRYFGSGEQLLPESQIQKPTSNPKTLPEHTVDDPHYDNDIAGEVARVQTAVSPKEGDTRIAAVTRHLNHTKNIDFPGNAPDCPEHEEMTPYIPHPVHEAFPIAMVCREPYGTPNHASVYNPQNEVWLSALRNAKKNVFIQSPTLNASPLIPAIIEACERGVDVYAYVCLGYNDTGELLPKQGGTNEMVIHNLTTTLSPTGKPHLHPFFYIAKDQTLPILAAKKRRSCHVKLMIVDEHIGIQGNGNQDTQSWFHSQEINVMIDSEVVCAAWIDGLRRNQNTHLYGAVGEDGIWRDEKGKEAEGVIGIDPGRFPWAKGVMGAVRRVRGVGDF